jgi:archaeosine synthase beta-subunit
VARNDVEPLVDAAPYPDTPSERDRWVLERRVARAALDPRQPQAFLIEQERSAAGEIVPVATLFLTNRECPWRCVMCDLWRHTLEETLPAGAIPAQIDHALARLGPARQIKLYNSGSFFDQRAIPVADHPAIADRVRDFDRVIVECHPSLVGERVLGFHDQVSAKLEIALGLETAHPDVLGKLHKRMTLEDFSRAAGFLRQHGIAVRAFVLVQPPFLTDDAEALHWARRSVEFAFDQGAGVVSLIPTRPGNGALEALAAAGQFRPPRLDTLEAALDHGIGLGRGRVFADLWDLEPFSRCPACFAARRARLETMNLHQQVLPRVPCSECA